MSRIVLTAVTALLLLCAPFVEASLTQRPTAPAKDTHVPQIMRKQFEALPMDHVFELKGQRITKRELLARMEQRRCTLKTNIEAQTAKEDARLQAKRSAFLREEAAKLDAENKKTRRQLASLGSPDTTPATGVQRSANPRG